MGIGRVRYAGLGEICRVGESGRLDCIGRLGGICRVEKSTLTWGFVGFLNLKTFDDHSRYLF